MKNILKITSFFLATLFFSCCNNDDDKPIAEIDKLPAETQTGANTFGCLLDGKAFLPGNFPNATNCFYQFVDGEYYFLVSAANDTNDNLKVIRLRTEKNKSLKVKHTICLNGLMEMRLEISQIII